MVVRKFFSILTLLLCLVLLPVISLRSNPKEVKGVTVEPAPTQISSVPEETIPRDKFYAPILSYHHIARRWPQNSYYVSPEIFDEERAWLKVNGYRVISFDDFYLAARGQGTLPPKPVVLTFDDGNRDQYTNAFPILKKYGLTATFFIIVKGVGRGGITWEELKELIEAGNIVGSHTINHPNLSKMSPLQLKYELEESKKILEENLGTKINYLNYPGGAFSQRVLEAARDAGYLAAVTTRHRVEQEIKNNDSFFTLPRVHVDDEMPTFIDWVQGINLE